MSNHSDLLKPEPVPGWPGYFVNRMGSVFTTICPAHSGRTNYRMRPMRQQRNDHGYYFIILHRPGLKKSVRVAEIVLSTFIGPRPAGCDSDHIHGVRSDNRLSELRWLTRSQNIRAAADRNGGRPGGRGENHWTRRRGRIPASTIREIVRLVRDGECSQAEAARRMGVSKPTVCALMKGSTRRDLAGMPTTNAPEPGTRRRP
ncbi:MAG: virus Ardmore [Pseudomonadota bacterium]